MRRTTVLLVLAVCLGACSSQEKREARKDLKDAGRAVKKELKQDAAFVKEEALKAREATQKGVKKLREDVKSEPDRDGNN